MKPALPLAAAAVVALALGAGMATVWLPRAADRPPPPVPMARAAMGAAAATLPEAQWTPRFRDLVERGSWEELDRLLDRLRREAPAAYAGNRLAYLHARAAQGAGDEPRASELLAPYLAVGEPWRPLALHHAAELARARGDGPGAALLERQLLRDSPGSLYWQQTLDDQLAWLEARGNPAATLELVATLQPLATDAPVQRQLAAARVAALFARHDEDTALSEGTKLLARSTTDDAAERVGLLLDQTAMLPRLSGPQLRDLAEGMQHHRRWDRAVEVYTLARRALPAERATIDFAMARARFFAERYADAERLFRRSALEARDRGEKANALYQAARAAALRGKDAVAMRLLDDAIAVPVRAEPTVAATTSRLRLLVHQGRLAQAARDAALLRRLAPNNSAIAQGAVAVAMGELAAGHDGDAAAALQNLPATLGASDRAEIAYWRGRALERADPVAAVATYLDVLRAEVPTHFAYLARQRLAQQPLRPSTGALAAARRQAARESLQRGELERARELQTDAVLIAGDAADLEALAAIYRQLPSYREVLELAPNPLPAFPLREPAPDALLSAMGLLDEAVGTVSARYPLQPLASGLTRAYACHLGGASRASIGAAESLLEHIPRGYVPQLLPRLLRELLYPRSFWTWIDEDARRYGADPRLLLAIMREESRFNPRAKSSAAARGLMQLVITTARQVAVTIGLVQPTVEDLYDPRLVIQLGAKYVGDLMGQLDRDPYATAAAYNAGPTQARAWLRLAPAPGHDDFLSTIGFAETKDYVAKVLDSYERYGEIYPEGPPTGGTRAQP